MTNGGNFIDSLVGKLQIKTESNRSYFLEYLWCTAFIPVPLLTVPPPTPLTRNCLFGLN